MVSTRFAADQSAVGMGRKLNLPNTGSDFADCRDGSVYGEFDFFVDVIPEIARHGHAQRHGFFFNCAWIVDRWKLLTINILGIVSGDGLKHECGISGRPRHWANMIERP